MHRLLHGADFSACLGFLSSVSGCNPLAGLILFSTISLGSISMIISIERLTRSMAYWRIYHGPDLKFKVRERQKESLLVCFLCVL